VTLAKSQSMSRANWRVTVRWGTEVASCCHGKRLVRSRSNLHLRGKQLAIALSCTQNRHTLHHNLQLPISSIKTYLPLYPVHHFTLPNPISQCVRITVSPCNRALALCLDCQDGAHQPPSLEPSGACVFLDGLCEQPQLGLTWSSFELFLLSDGEKKITEKIFTGKHSIRVLSGCMGL
jgi:hypothetical protein